MLGVVVWAAKSDSTAIVWCEDQGDLAFLEMQTHTAVAPERFNKGDLIQFDVTQHHDVRVAHNPRRIAQHYCVGLDDVVAKATAMHEGAPVPEEPVDGLASASPYTAHNVIDLSLARAQRQRSVA